MPSESANKLAEILLSIDEEHAEHSIGGVICPMCVIDLATAIEAAIDERWEVELKGVLVKLDKLQQKVEGLKKRLDEHGTCK